MKIPRRAGHYNTKRKIHEYSEAEVEHYSKLAGQVQYGGNPEHKKNPGDFGLTPPSSPRSAKSLCDSVAIFEKQIALRLLKDSLKKGMYSIAEKNGWPQNIWAVDKNGNPLEAQLENQETGTYHGYPVPESDPFGEIIIKEWGKH